jgi:hypothetical protein
MRRTRPGSIAENFPCCDAPPSRILRTRARTPAVVIGLDKRVLAFDSYGLRLE